ncbi:GtrA family protein [Enterobacter cloacae subsp. cloacae]|uniref:GtrA-like protein n=2 Tax=Enterobacter cloacae TaxID=550 RepID=A0A377LX50_ENTCL|nr:GtrA family protein [Enterobacter cloacae]KGB12190.1 gtrA-like family protein [Enterobacter cloacae]MBW4207362.1 GtrA family protein [Enterobacter cloacae subsp. cloacae]MBW4230093.1 GtrA family protein [Enterobacter cloacae subsp. cloacae]MCJ8535234.1 GtrA family protein [Enterobacter cloacae]MCK6740979.1 GtrA family protein [Enterobacter cloacae]
MSINLASIYRNQALRYCLVGGMNTAVTAVVIITLTAAGVGLYFSNFAGYVVGVLFSFILNTVFTFSSKPSATKLLKFLTCCGVCYAINLFTMNIAMLSGAENVYFVQLTGMFFYTVSGFIINKLWVMK